MGRINMKQVLNSKFIERDGLKIYYMRDPREIEILDLDEDGKEVMEVYQIRIIGIADQNGKCIFYNSLVKNINALEKQQLKSLLHLEEIIIGKVAYYYKYTGEFLRGIRVFIAEEKGIAKIHKITSENLKELKEIAALEKRKEEYFKQHDIPENERHLISESFFRSLK